MKAARKKRKKTCGTSPCICLTREGERSNHEQNSNQSTFPSVLEVNAEISQKSNDIVAMESGSPYQDFANAYYDGERRDTDKNLFKQPYGGSFSYGKRSSMMSRNYIGLGAALDSESKLSEEEGGMRKSRVSLAPRTPRAVDYYVPNPTRRSSDPYKLPRASLDAPRQVHKRVHVKTQTASGESESSSDESFTSQENMFAKTRKQRASTVQPTKFTNVNVLPGMPSPQHSYGTTDSRSDREERQSRNNSTMDRNDYEDRSEIRRSRRSTQRSI